MNILLSLGNQLFDPKHWPADLKSVKDIFLREDVELCTYFRFHKQKIVFFLAAMRSYRDELEQQKIKVHYQELSGQKQSYEESLSVFIKENKVQKIFIFEIEDKFFETRLLKLFADLKVDFHVLESPMFLTSRAQLSLQLKDKKRPFMKTFYEAQRKRLKILVDKKDQPQGGQWSFDSENRLPLPPNVVPPAVPKFKTNSNIEAVKKVCDQFFGDHPGETSDFWLPVNRAGAHRFLQHFLKEKLELFGPYEDALAQHSDFVFHSVLTPFLNVGLLTPNQIVEATLEHAEKNKTPLASLEGFLRQVIGWREFVHGIYQNFSERQDAGNFWKHQRGLSEVWYSGDSGVPQLDRSLDKVFKTGYAHHIERLMVFGNLMLLLEIEPKIAHRWFMEMFIDSSDWVMGPNVYGMALFSDGGIFATKPYICGSNYWRKMSKEKAGPWCDAIDGLYWQFIDKHRVFFSTNPRLSMMVRSFDKMAEARKKSIFAAADELKEKLTCVPKT